MDAPEATEASEYLHYRYSYKCHESSFIIFRNTVHENPKMKPAPIKNEKREDCAVKKKCVRCVKGDGLY